MLQDAHLMIFAKAPEPGEVKTRLASSVGAEEACRIYRQLLAEVLENLRGLTGVELRFTPDDRETDFTAYLQKSWFTRAQGAGDLGARLTRAFLDAFEDGARRVVAIGSDCPEVIAADITEAWQALEDHDVVLGPATDGGYWLIGLRAAHPEIFRGIPWSSESVFAATCESAKKANLSTYLLRVLSDVDTDNDWRRFRQRKME